MKKILISLIVVLSLVVSLTACSKPSTNSNPDSTPSQENLVQVQIPEFTLAIEGVDGVSAFTNKEAATLNVVEMQSSVTNKNGETTTSNYTGVLLKDVLASLGVTEVQKVIIEASDGYQVNYDAEMAFADDVIVAWYIDGKEMENGEIRVSPAQASGKTLAKMAAKIIVE